MKSLATGIGHCPRLAFCLGLLIFSSDLNAITDGASPQHSDDLKLIQGLRQRRLFDQARFYCQQQLERAEEGSPPQVDLSIELIRVQSDRALHSDAENRGQNLEAAVALAVELAQRHARHPRRVLIDVQQALTWLTIAELQQRQFDLEPDDWLRQESLGSSRRAKSVLQDVQREVADRLASARQQQAVDPATLSVDECLNLQRNLGLQLARCAFIRARLYGADDRLNRISALSDVLLQLTELQKLNAPGESLWWETQLAMVECYRLLEQFDDAASLLDRTNDKALDSSRAKWLAEVLRQKLELALARSDRAEVQQALDVADRIAARSPDLDLAGIRAVLWLAEQAGDREAQQNFLASAQQRVELLGQQHGVWWERQGDQLLSELAPNRPTTGNNDQPLASGVRQAEALEAAGQHREAADFLRQLATKHIRSELAPSIHLRACWNLLRADSDPVGTTDVVDALQQHLQFFPDASTSDQARFWLGQHLYRQRQWTSAARVLLETGTDSRYRIDALELAVRSISKAVDVVEFDAGRRTAVQPWLDRLMPDDSGQPDTIAVLSAAELAIRYDAVPKAWGNGASVASRLSAPQFENQPAAIQHAAVALRIPAMFLDAAESSALQSTVDWLTKAPPAESVKKCASVLKSIQPRVPESKLAEYRQATLACVDAILASSDKPIAYWQQEKATLLGQLGRFDESLEILKPLAVQYPKQAGLQMQFARFQTQALGTDDRLTALQTWRDLASRLKPNTDDWFEAKYHVARLLLDSGQPVQARQLLDYLAALPGGWSESAFADRFDALSNELGRPDVAGSD